MSTNAIRIDTDTARLVRLIATMEDKTMAEVLRTIVRNAASQYLASGKFDERLTTITEVAKLP